MSMKLSENAAIIKLGRQAGSELNLVLAWDESHMALIDAGVPGQAGEICGAIAALGRSPESLTHLIVTHQDWDHVGSAGELRKIAPGMKVVAHAEEAPYIDGTRLPIKLAARLAQYGALPDGDRGFVDAWKDMYEKEPLPVDIQVHDGEVLDICGGLEFVHVPGHTPGHIAVLLRGCRVMVCGDAANIKDGRLAGSNPAYTHDMELADKSLKKIGGYGISGIVAYHGGYLGLPEAQ